MLIPEGRLHLTSDFRDWLEVHALTICLGVTFQVLWDGSSASWQQCLILFNPVTFCSKAQGSWTCSLNHFVAIRKWVRSVFLPFLFFFKAVDYNDSRLPLWSWNLSVENVRLCKIKASSVFQVCEQAVFHLLIHDDGAYKARGISTSSTSPFNSWQRSDLLSNKEDSIFHIQSMQLIPRVCEILAGVIFQLLHGHSMLMLSLGHQ